MIKYQVEEWGWEFLFLGANIDAAEVAKDIGVAAERAVGFLCDGGGLGLGYDAIPERWVKAVKTCEEVDALIEKFLDAVEKESVFPKVLDLIRQTKKVCSSHIQRELDLGYNQASRMMDWLQEEGYVSLVENYQEVLDEEGRSFTDAYKINWEKF